MTGDYWGSFQVLVGVVLVAVAVRLAFPRLRVPMVIVGLLAVVAAAYLPGAPGEVRVSAALVALLGVVALVRRPAR